jgi:hypothetical protein
VAVPAVLPRTELNDSNRWRRSYPSPEEVISIGLDAVAMLKGNAKQQKERRTKARQRQHEHLMRTGFVGKNPELGHRVAYELRCRGYHETVCVYAGHLASIGGAWNFQGNHRIAQLMRKSVRTIQRARALLELDKLVRSCLLEPGQMVDGQKCPVTRPQVVRDVSPLQRLANVRTHSRMQPHKRSAKKHDNTTAAAVVAAVKGPTADELAEIAADAPDFLRSIIAGAAAGKRELEEKQKAPEPKREPMPDYPPAVEAEELDALDRELEQIEHELRAQPPDKPTRH